MRIGIRAVRLVTLATFATLAATGAIAADSPSRGPGDIPALLDRMARAYGGREFLADFGGFRARGKVLSLSDGVNGTVALNLSLEGDLRSEISYPHRMETRILSGPLAWSGGMHHQRPAESEMAASMRLQFHRLAAPFELAATDPEQLAWEGWSDEGYARLRRDWGKETRTTYEIDPASGEIRRIRGEVGSGNDAIRFETESADFRDVDGTRFPFRMTTTISGHAAWEMILDRVRRQSRFEPQTFLPSGSAGDI